MTSSELSVNRASIFQMLKRPAANAVICAPGVDIKKSEIVREDEAGSHAHAGSQEALDGENYHHSQELSPNCPKHPYLSLDSETAR